MASVIAAAAHSLFEVDEIEASRFKDEVYYTFVTTGILPETAELKTKLWAYLAPPVKRLEVLGIEEIEKGLIAKRYKIHVKGKVIGKTIGQKQYRLFNLKPIKKKKSKKRKRR